jgi:hypothetical protein
MTFGDATDIPDEKKRLLFRHLQPLQIMDKGVNRWIRGLHHHTRHLVADVRTKYVTSPENSRDWFVDECKKIFGAEECRTDGTFGTFGRLFDSIVA